MKETGLLSFGKSFYAQESQCKDVIADLKMPDIIDSLRTVLTEAFFVRADGMKEGLFPVMPEEDCIAQAEGRI